MNAPELTLKRLGQWSLKLHRLGWGFLAGCVAVLMLEWPRVWAWWAFASDESTLSEGIEPPRLAPEAVVASNGAQQVQALPDEGQADQTWRALRQLHQAQGLRVLQWQADESRPATPAWPLIVQQALLVAHGPAASWHRFWPAWRQQPGLWRLEQLSLRPERVSGAGPQWRVQARWQLAVRPGAAQGPFAPALAETSGVSDSGPVLPRLPASADVPVATSDITDWPLAQLRWVGWWRSEGRQELVFSVPGQLFRVQAGEAVGREGYRWQGEIDGSQLVLQAGAGARHGQVLPAFVKLELEAVP